MSVSLDAARPRLIGVPALGAWRPRWANLAAAVGSVRGTGHAGPASMTAELRALTVVDVTIRRPLSGRLGCYPAAVEDKRIPAAGLCARDAQVAAEVDHAR